MPRRHIDATLAQEAINLVTGPRQQSYAHPAVNFARIAKGWEMILGQLVTPEQVGLCMVIVKLARQVNAHSRDNYADAIGYLLTADAAREDD